MSVARVKAAIQAAADALGTAGRALQVALGDPTGANIGGYETLPDFKRGRSWQRDVGNQPSTLDLQLEALRTEYSCSARILTSATGVAPTLSWATGIASAAKNESSEYVEVTLSEAYLDTTFVVCAYIPAVTTFPTVTQISSTVFRVTFYDPSTPGTPLNINDRVVMASTLGRAVVPA